jgi:hypothetical protein
MLAIFLGRNLPTSPAFNDGIIGGGALQIAEKLAVRVGISLDGTNVSAATASYRPASSFLLPSASSRSFSSAGASRKEGDHANLFNRHFLCFHVSSFSNHP